MTSSDSWDKCTLCDVNYEFINQKENDFTPIQGVCGHYFCRLCILKWYYHNVDRTKRSNLKFIQCPLCKGKHSFRVDRLIPNRGVCLALEARQKESSSKTQSAPSPSPKDETITHRYNEDGSLNLDLLSTKLANQQQVNESSYMKMTKNTPLPTPISENNDLENKKKEKKKKLNLELYEQAQMNIEIIQDKQTIAERVQKRNAKSRNQDITKCKMKTRSKIIQSRTKKKIETTISSSSSISSSSFTTIDNSSCLTNGENKDYRVRRSKANAEKKISSNSIIKRKSFTDEENIYGHSSQAKDHDRIIHDEHTIAKRVRKRNVNSLNQNKLKFKRKTRSKIIKSKTKKKIESTISSISSYSSSSFTTLDSSSYLTDKEKTTYRVTRSKSNAEKELSSNSIIKRKSFTNEEYMCSRVTRSKTKADKEISSYSISKLKHRKALTKNKTQDPCAVKANHNNSTKSKTFTFQRAKGLKRKKIVPSNEFDPSVPNGNYSYSNISIKIGKTMIRKHFPGHGYFYGKVVGFDDDNPFYLVEYTDGDRETLSRNEVMKYACDFKEHMLEVPKNNFYNLCDSDDSDNS